MLLQVASPDTGVTGISNVVPSIRTDNDNDIPVDKPSISNNTLFEQDKKSSSECKYYNTTYSKNSCS